MVLALNLVATPLGKSCFGVREETSTILLELHVFLTKAESFELVLQFLVWRLVVCVVSYIGIRCTSYFISWYQLVT